MSTVKLNHPILGTFKGIAGDGVEQFFGIQYATLKDRLAEPVVRTKYDGDIDARKHG
jgi:carboxylesterase type B